MAITIIRIVLGAVLVGAIFLAGLHVYRRLPTDESWARADAYDTNSSSELVMIMRSDSVVTPAHTQIEIYPIDYAAAQRDFSAAVRPGKTFDDFLAQRMKGLKPARAQLDDKGRAAAKLSAGVWWIRATATLASGETVEWRLPVNVFGREQTVEFTTENAYEKTKKF